MANEPSQTPTSSTDPAALAATQAAGSPGSGAHPPTSPGPGATGDQQGGSPSSSNADPQSGRFVALDRFNGVVADKYNAIRQAEQERNRAAELERQVADLQARLGGGAQASASAAPGAAPATPIPPTINPGEIDRLAAIRAEQINFNNRCNDSVAKGRKAYNDFDSSIAELRKVSTLIDTSGQPTLPQALIEAALETGRGHDVLYALGKDTAEADRIMSLSNNPVRQAVEVARFAQGLKPVAEATPADPGADPAAPVITLERPVNPPPAPIKPVVGASRGVSVKEMKLDDPNLPMEEFVRRRNAEDAERRKAGRFR